MAKVIICDICGEKITKSSNYEPQFVLPMHKEFDIKNCGKTLGSISSGIDSTVVDLCPQCQKIIADFLKSQTKV